MLFRKKPLVSVVIPSYNHAAFVKEAVVSVLEQDIQDLEIIVVDDGSNDGTPDIVASIKDKRLRLVRLNENRKVHPRNKGLKMAEGRYVAFQNSDDVWAKNKLSSQLSIMSEDSSIAACFTAVELIDKNGKKAGKTWAEGLYTTKNRTNTEWLKQFFSPGNCLCISSALLPRRMLKKTGLFQESLFQLSDLDLWIRLSALGNLHVVNEPLTKMRILGSENFSSPSFASEGRYQLEFAEVLQRYTRPPILALLPEIFDEDVIDSNKPLVVQIASLALFAKDLSPSHKIFAGNTLKKIIDSPKDRRIVTEHLGSDFVHEFIKLRGELRLV